LRNENYHLETGKYEFHMALKIADFLRRNMMVE